MTDTSHDDATDTPDDGTASTANDAATGPDATISEQTERLETIVEQLEDGEVSLERAQALHAEGQELLEALRDELDVEDGVVTVRE